jgi:hypothetical protein
MKSHNKVDTLDKEFTCEEIEESIKRLKMKKASGLDSISNEMLKAGKETLKPYICKLFNNIIKSECYPNIWSKGYIVPIYKKGEMEDPANYRGITISSCLGKLFATVVNNRLQKFLHDNIISKLCL